ncbi:hypothetical protein H6F74_03810 [Trichocoleus sp. FACHB-90]|uniref:hypothetical protein n=1 Tax=Cyanophyceae TaxID=3028117 RepID=UPI00168434AC|nr:hypothetical protein [Trichocoleus sp. FACHB-90]MBD1925415.1 hypothetical protein [Trichocoleus sp. FACHB-90]
MKTLFLDMEWGQIYGSYRRDFIPIEIGVVIYDPEHDEPLFEGKKFRHDVDIVIRKNIIDNVGKTIGLSEKVANIERGEYQKIFHSNYRLKSSDKVLVKRRAYKSLSELRQYMNALLKKHHIEQIVFFGGNEDIKLLQKANVDISKIKAVDIQHIICKEIGYLFSLDKISLIINFYSSNKYFGSKNFRYKPPGYYKYKYLIKPHRAIGDACRIFLVYREFHGVNCEFVQQCNAYLNANKPNRAISEVISKKIS